MLKNKRASIFIFILILINIILILGYVVFNNVTVINNNIDIGKNAEEVFKNVQQKGDINIKTDIQYNGNGNGYEDFISCPTNVTMSGTTSKETGISTEMNYSFGSYYCLGDYNGKEFRIFFDKTTHDFNRVYFEGDIVDLTKTDGSTAQGSNLAPGSTVAASTSYSSTYDVSYAYDDLVDSNSYISEFGSSRFIEFDFGSEKELYSMEIYKYTHSQWKYWDSGDVYYYDNGGNEVAPSSSLTGMRSKSYNLTDFRNSGVTGGVRKIKIVTSSYSYLDLKEVKIYEADTLVGGTSFRQGEREFNDSDDTLISFDGTGTVGGDNYDDNFNSDDYKVTSTGSIYYPGGFQDDDVIPRLTIFGDVRDSNTYQNIFWSNYETNAFIDKNTNNNDGLNLKMGDIDDANLYLDFFSDSENIQFDLKLYEFDRSAYEDENTLLLKKSYKVDNLTKNSGFIEMNNGELGLSTTRTSDTMSFDFKNKDYALFVINKLDSNLSYRITGETTTGTGLYINPLDDSGSGIIESLSNHMIIGDEKNFIGEQFIVVGNK